MGVVGRGGWIADQENQRKTREVRERFLPQPVRSRCSSSPRTTDLEGRTGQLRGFTLEGFLPDYAEGRIPYPWTVVSDAIQDKNLRNARRSPAEAVRGRPASAAARRQQTVSRSCLRTPGSQCGDPWGWVAAQVGIKQPFLVLFAQDAETAKEGEKTRNFLLAQMSKTLDCRMVEVRRLGGPFTDEETDTEAQLHKGKRNLSAQKLVRETKKEALMAVIALAWQMGRVRPDIVIGEGQSGIIAMGLSKPALLEAALQARNAQPDEVQKISEAELGLGTRVWANAE